MHQEIKEEEEDLWTHIPTKSKRHRKPPPPSSTPLPNLDTLNPPLKSLTLPQLSTDFNTRLKQWRSSTCRKTTLALLSLIKPESGWKLNKAICLGSGSLSRENWECRRRSLWQIVVFYDLAQHLLSEESGGRMFAQEPGFTELDKEFLSSLDIRVLESKIGDGGMGAAGDELGKGTFLFEPFVDMNVGMLESMLREDVGLYMGSSVSGILSRREVSEVGVLARKFCEGREMRKFPVFEVEPNVLEGVAIWWREEEEDE